MKPTLVYFGSPELAVPTLSALAESGEYRVLAAVTQTDKPAGRGKSLTPPPVKRRAEELGIPVFQPGSLKSIRLEGGTLHGEGSAAELVAFLNKHHPIDAFVVVAYGKIIPRSLIDLPRRGVINVHMSLLPHLRGAAPIQHSILRGDSRSGVSIMEIDEGLDTGPVYATSVVEIGPDETSGSLADRLVADGTRLLLATLPAILDGSISAAPQPTEGSSYADKLTKESFLIRWEEPVTQTMNRIRAGAPHPGAFTRLGNDPIKIYCAHPVANRSYPTALAGTIVESNGAELIVAAGNGEFLSIDELQLPGKKRLPVAEVLRGRKLDPGTRFE